MECDLNEDPKTNYPVQCFSCKVNFSGVEEFCKHVAHGCKEDNKAVKAKSIQTQFQCRQCFETFPTNRSYNKHWSVRHTEISKLLMFENPQPCKLCGLVFMNIRALHAHQVTCVKSTGFASSASNKVEHSSSAVMKESVATGINFTSINNVETRNNGFVPVYFSGYNQYDRGPNYAEENTSVNKMEYCADGAILSSNCGERPLPKIGNTFWMERNLFESFGVGISEETTAASENFQLEKPLCWQECATAVDSLAEVSLEEKFRNNIPRLPVDEKQPNVDKANLERRKTRRAVECRICHRNFSSLAPYRLHFQQVHADCSVDELFDDGWKCSLCSSVHKDIDGLKRHWVSKHKEFYNKEQFDEFMRTESYFN